MYSITTASGCMRKREREMERGTKELPEGDSPQCKAICRNNEESACTMKQNKGNISGFANW
jgi:hypothetical protein